MAQAAQSVSLFILGWLACDGALSAARAARVKFLGRKATERKPTSEQRQACKGIRGLNATDLNAAQQLLEAAKRAVGADAAGPKPLLPGDVVTIGRRSASEEREWNAVGLQLLAHGHAGVLLLAGGQGTRLGSDLPKGCYDIGLPSGKSLFQLHAEHIRRLQALAVQQLNNPLASCTIMWYIMTSAATHGPTLRFFAKHEYFGLLRTQVFFFQQADLLCLTSDGDPIVLNDHTVARAPDGNGGVFAALRASGALVHMRQHNVRCLDCICVDNAVARLGDPLFLGACWATDAHAGARVVLKEGEGEKVGVFARRGRQIEVVEYSELPEQAAGARAASDGQLQFKWANICMHYFNVDWLEGACQQFAEKPRYHLARKRIKCQQGEVEGIKLEQFIFDCFPLATKTVLMEVRRMAEFAPVKNAPGSAAGCTPEDACKAVLSMHRHWVERAGGKVLGGQDAGLEVSPLVSYAGEGLDKVCQGNVYDHRAHIA